VTSPNEPGPLKKADSPNGDSSVERAGAHRATSGQGARSSPDTAESPPWQRGAARAANSAPRQPEPPSEARSSASPSGADARLNRFISGASATGSSQSQGKNPPTEELEAVGPRHEGPPAEAYASELPDLSGPLPRAAQRKRAPERSEAGVGAGSTSGSVRSATSEARETREPREAREPREPRESRESRESREGHVQVSRRTRGPVRASMQIRRIDPWSTLKVSLMLSVSLFFVWMIAVAFLYLVLGGMGVWAKLNSNVGDLLNNTSGSSAELVSSSTIFGGAILIGLVNIVLLTAMATIAAFVYNLATDLIGGIEVTLADRD